MAFDDDLLADLGELDENVEEMEEELNTVADNDVEMVTLGEISHTSGIGQEHKSIISKLASQSADIHNIAKMCYSTDLKQLLGQIQQSQQISVAGKTIVGRVEDDPDYQLVLTANDVVTRISGEMLVVHRFLIDHYEPRFPELETLVRSPVEYAQSIKAIGDMEDITKADLDDILPSATCMVVTVTGSTTVGRVLKKEDLVRVIAACDCLLELVEAKSQIVAFIESRMPLIAPNMTAIVGPATAAKLIVEAGGLTALSKMPSCNFHVLGKAHQTATGLSSLSSNKHAGVIYYCEAVQNVPEDFRQKMLRKVSAKCALAARVDAQHQSTDGSMGKKFKADLDTQVEKLLEAAPMNAVKALPIPDEGPKRRRGGRKVRKAKEPYMVTELQKQRDRLQFGKFQDEVVVMDEMEGMGMMGQSAGRVRATQLNNRAKAKAAKKYEKYMKAPSAAAASSGIASIAFTPVQGFELANPQNGNSGSDVHKSKRTKTAHDKYFASSTPFLGKRDSSS